jgi:uncharacterized membrane protein (DUF106 family)
VLLSFSSQALVKSISSSTSSQNTYFLKIFHIKSLFLLFTHAHHHQSELTTIVILSTSHSASTTQGTFNNNKTQILFWMFICQVVFSLILKKIAQ